MVSDKIPFNIWLKRQRRALDLTQKDLAQSIGCSVVTIKKWEAGELLPSKDLAEILAGHFSIPAEERPAFARFVRSKSDSSASDVPLQRAGTSPWHRLNSLPNNLPAPPNAFIGRGDEVEAIQALLHSPGVRLLTLSGPPGIGKTRTSLEVAAEILADPEDATFADGVYFVALAPINDLELFVTSIARTLGVYESGGQALLESLKSYLQGKKLLLILDNFEQIVAAAPVLGEILSAAPQLKATVTSREVLHIYGEHDFPMHPLDLPLPGEDASFQDLMQYGAVRLFVERAISANPAFKLTGENAQTIAEVCLRLDGLPLAIELAAGHIKSLSPENILSKLESRLELLVGGPIDMPARQRALRTAIDWSYNLLDEQERALFRHLSVFVGGATVDAVETVVENALSEETSVQATLSSLLNKSLIRREAAAGVEPRFVMLETIREYALGMLLLVESGEAAVIRRKHASYFLDIAEQAAAELRGPKQATWIARLEREHDNFRAALRTCRETQDAVTGLRLAAALWRFWHTRGYLSEGREHLSAILSIPVDNNNDSSGNALFEEIRAKALNGAGVFALMQGDYASATPLYEESLAIYQRLEDKAGMASTLSNLANVAYYQEDFEKAVSMHEETLAIYKELADKGGVSKSLNNLAIVVRNQGDYVRARSLLLESLKIKREVGDKEGISSVLNNLAEVVELQGNLEEARSLFEESLSLRLELGNKRGMAETMEGLANVNSLLGMPEQAAYLWGAAEALREAIGTPLLSADLDEYVREVAAAHFSLDEAAWSRIWAEGRSMTPEQAYAYALGKQV